LKNLAISSDLQEKIYDVKRDSNENIVKITTYFPLNSQEKQKILASVEKTKRSKINFKSIFSDEISEQEWVKSKGQIKKKFQDELMEID